MVQKGIVNALVIDALRNIEKASFVIKLRRDGNNFKVEFASKSLFKILSKFIFGICWWTFCPSKAQIRRRGS